MVIFGILANALPPQQNSCINPGGGQSSWSYGGGAGYDEQWSN